MRRIKGKDGVPSRDSVSGVVGTPDIEHAAGRAPKARRRRRPSHEITHTVPLITSTLRECASPPDWPWPTLVVPGSTPWTGDHVPQGHDRPQRERHSSCAHHRPHRSSLSDQVTPSGEAGRSDDGQRAVSSVSVPKPRSLQLLRRCASCVDVNGARESSRRGRDAIDASTRWLGRARAAVGAGLEGACLEPKRPEEVGGCDYAISAIKPRT